VAEWLGEAFPWGTVAINLLGSFVIGAFAALTGAGGSFEGNMSVRLFVIVGICGGFTTFSSFSLQTMMLLRSGQAVAAFANVAVSVVVCLLATMAGAALFTRG
jgi:CrcB protein